MRQEINILLNKYSRIKLYHHVQPDGDCLGSQYGIYHLIKENFKNKEIELITDSTEKVPYFNYDINQTKDYIDENKDYLAIILDTSSLGRVSGFSWKEAKDIIVIDHHSATTDADWSSVNKNVLKMIDINKTSNCINIVKIANESGWVINQIAYRFLGIGMTTDNLNRAFVANRDRDWEIIQQVADNSDLKDIAEQIYTKDKISLKSKILVLSKMKSSELINWAIIKREDYKKEGLEWDSVFREVNLFAVYEKPLVWFMATETDPGLYKVEFRSTGVIKVNEIAVELGGGGHIHSSGCTQTEEVVNNLFNIIKRKIEEVNG